MSFVKKLCEANACRVTNFLSNKSFGLCYLPCTFDLGKIEDVEKVSKDPEYREKLLKDYGLAKD